jgi:very-short-patch-repair endonuclease
MSSIVVRFWNGAFLCQQQQEHEKCATCVLPMCCRKCNRSWKMYEVHNGTCWPCIKSAWEAELTLECSRRRGFCTDSDKCRNCFARSAASVEKSLFWAERNQREPRIVPKFSHTDYWFDCPECHHCVNISPAHVATGTWCRYCANRERCADTTCQHCYGGSFASHPLSKYWSLMRNGSLTPRDVALRSATKYWFDCPVCKHCFDTSTDAIGAGKWCRYCDGKDLCKDTSCKYCAINSFASHPRSERWSRTLNGVLTPRDVTISSGEKYWFDCADCKDSFGMALNHVMKGQWCPACKYKTERKLYDWLRTMFASEKVVTQAIFDWCRSPATNRYLRFDFYLPELRLIIELDGPQHWRQISNWGPPEKIQLNDRYKMKCANDQGLTVIRIVQEDVLYDRYDWKASVEKHLITHEKPDLVFLGGDEDIYTNIGYCERTPATDFISGIT